MLDDDADDDDDHFACNFLLFFLLGVELISFFFLLLCRSNAYIHKGKTILDMCKAVAFLLRRLFPILFDVEMRASLFDFSARIDRARASTACLIHYSHICARMQRMTVEREHTHQCNEDEDTSIIRWEWRILASAWKWEREKKGERKRTATSDQYVQMAWINAQVQCEI